MSSAERFEYRFDNRFALLFKALGVGADDAVEVSSTTLRATFGRVSLTTGIDNVSGTEITGPHRFYTAVGLRLSLVDDGLTFGTNYERGICLSFAERVPRVMGFRDHSALWVSVADPEGLAASIAALRGGS